MEKKVVNFIVEKTGTGYSAWSNTHSILAVGSDMNELIEDIKSGLQTHCQYMKDDITQYKITLDLEKAF